MEKVNMKLEDVAFKTHTVTYTFHFILDDGTECVYVWNLNRDAEPHKEELMSHFTSYRYCSEQYPIVRGAYARHSEGIVAIGHIYEDMFFMKDGSSEVIPYRQVISNWKSSHN